MRTGRQELKEEPARRVALVERQILGAVVEQVPRGGQASFLEQPLTVPDLGRAQGAGLDALDALACELALQRQVDRRAVDDPHGVGAVVRHSVVADDMARLVSQQILGEVRQAQPVEHLLVSLMLQAQPYLNTV